MDPSYPNVLGGGVELPQFSTRLKNKLKGVLGVLDHFFVRATLTLHPSTALYNEHVFKTPFKNVLQSARLLERAGCGEKISPGRHGSRRRCKRMANEASSLAGLTSHAAAYSAPKVRHSNAQLSAPSRSALHAARQSQAQSFQICADRC